MWKQSDELTRIIPYKDRVADFVLIQKNVGHQKPIFSHILRSETYR